MKRETKKNPQPEASASPPPARCLVCEHTADSRHTPQLCTLHASALRSHATKGRIAAVRGRVRAALGIL